MKNVYLVEKDDSNVFTMTTQVSHEHFENEKESKVIRLTYSLTTEISRFSMSRIHKLKMASLTSSMCVIFRTPIAKCQFMVRARTKKGRVAEYALVVLFIRSSSREGLTEKPRLNCVCQKLCLVVGRELCCTN